MENQQPAIQDYGRVAANCQKLASILKVIVLCGRQNSTAWPSWQHHSLGEWHPTENHSNFWALLNFRVDSGDRASCNCFTQRHIHIVSDPKSASWCLCWSNQILKRAVRYTVVADEVTDVSNKEQLSVVLRYVDPDTVLVQEDLTSFFECDKGISESSFAKKNTDSLESFSLDIGKLQGQSKQYGGHN